jgi:hypothetical protein
VTTALYAPPATLDGIARRAFLVGAAAIVVGLIGAAFDATQFFFSYLIGFMFVLGMTLGSLALLLLQHLTGGSWGISIRRPLEAASRTLPLVAILFLPLLLGLSHLYAWSRPEVVAVDELIAHKRPYLNVPFFLVRAAIYFVVWGLLTYFASRWSLEQDRTGHPSLPRRLQALGAGGLLAYVLTMTFASFDWVMSLDAHWFSTIFGILMVGGQAISAMSVAIVTMYLLTRHGSLSGVLGPAHFHDLGKLLLAFVMLWAYFSFSQYMIIWFGNLPEEIPWYLHRLLGGWHYIAAALVLLHFAVPFLLLLPRATKRKAERLASVAAFLLLMRVVDLFWLIAPEHHTNALRVHWMDLLLPIGLGSLWLAAYLRQLSARPLLPIGDPRLGQALAFRSH